MIFFLLLALMKSKGFQNELLDLKNESLIRISHLDTYGLGRCNSFEILLDFEVLESIRWTFKVPLSKNPSKDKLIVFLHSNDSNYNIIQGIPTDQVIRIDVFPEIAKMTSIVQVKRQFLPSTKHCTHEPRSLKTCAASHLFLSNATCLPLYIKSLDYGLPIPVCNSSQTTLTAYNKLLAAFEAAE